MPDPGFLLTAAVIFLLAGMVKGVIGLGLPTVCLALFALFVDLPVAMALLVVPSFVTNAWQAGVGGNGAALLRRLWPFLLAATLFVWVGGQAVVLVNPTLLSLLLGLLLLWYSAISLKGTRIDVPPQKEGWTGPALGAVNGVLTGLTGSFVVPGVLYLQAIGLPRDQLVQAMGILFTLSTVALAASLGSHGLLTADLGLISMLGVVPALIGMAVGQRLRNRLSEERFRRVFFWSLLALGLWIASKASTS